MQAAGGMSHDGESSILARTADVSSIRTGVCLGSPALVEMCFAALRHSSG
jgi:hypothetical protein